jgi:4-hydroxy-4-methyl-2-oxoglutarate aldolase
MQSEKNMAGEIISSAGLPEQLNFRLRELSSPTICEVLVTPSYMDSEIRPLWADIKLVGPAVTVLCHVGDNITLHKAIEVCQAGDVLVVNAGGYKEAGGMWGEIMTLAAQKKGVQGLVIDGAVRDVRAIRKLRFPIFARAVSPGRTVKKTFGQINGSIVCGGVPVNPGDIIFGDDDGVVVVPRSRLEEVIEKGEQRQARENEIKRMLDQGKTTMEIFGFDKIPDRENK